MSLEVVSMYHRVWFLVVLIAVELNTAVCQCDHDEYICCYPTRYKMDLISAIHYFADSASATAKVTGSVAIDAIRGFRSAVNYFTPLNGEAPYTEQIIQKITDATGQLWEIKGGVCTITPDKVVQPYFFGLLNSFTKLDPILIGRGGEGANCTSEIHPYYIKQSGYEVTMYATSDCFVTNVAWQFGIADAIRAYYGNYVEITDSSDFDDLFAIPDICLNANKRSLDESGKTLEEMRRNLF